MRIATVLLAATVWFALGGQARAGFEFQFANSSGTATSSFTIDFGVQTFVDVRLYLLATGASDINTLRNDGLKSYGLKLSYGGVEAQVLNDAAITSNAGFTDAEVPDVTTTSAAINDNIDNVSATVKAGAAEDRILLATFRFTGLSNGTMTITTSDPGPGLGVDDTVTGGNSVLDALIANHSAQITVTAVPEPGTMALTGLAAAAFGWGAWRRSRVIVS